MATDYIKSVCDKGIVFGEAEPITATPTQDKGTHEGAVKAAETRRMRGGFPGASARERIAAHEALAKANAEELKTRQTPSHGAPSYEMKRAMAKTDRLIGMNREMQDTPAFLMPMKQEQAEARQAGKQQIYSSEGKVHNPHLAGTKAAEREYRSQLASSASRNEPQSGQKWQSGLQGYDLVDHLDAHVPGWEDAVLGHGMERTVTPAFRHPTDPAKDRSSVRSDTTIGHHFDRDHVREAIGEGYSTRGGKIPVPNNFSDLKDHLAGYFQDELEANR